MIQFLSRTVLFLSRTPPIARSFSGTKLMTQSSDYKQPEQKEHGCAVCAEAEGRQSLEECARRRPDVFRSWHGLSITGVRR